MNLRLSMCRALLLPVGFLALSACAESTAPPTAAHAPSSLRASSSATPSATADKIHTERIAVSFGDVKKLASMLRDVLDVGGPREGQIRAILVDDASGDLVVFGTDEGIGQVRRMIAGLSVIPADKGVEVEVVPLVHATAANVAHAVRPTANPGAKVIVDEPTNSIILSASLEERDRLRRVIAALDVEAKAR